jgi:putative transposase
MRFGEIASCSGVCVKRRAPSCCSGVCVKRRSPSRCSGVCVKRRSPSRCSGVCVKRRRRQKALGTSASTRSTQRVPNTPPRLSLIFQAYDPPLYFVTFNSRRRRKLLANAAVHEALVQFGSVGAERGIAIGRYVIMPDHIHLFARGNDDCPLGQWMRLLKRRLSQAMAAEKPHWQKGFFDHVIPHGESYNKKWNYVRDNPVRAGLVRSADEWPWQGELARLEM